MPRQHQGRSAARSTYAFPSSPSPAQGSPAREAERTQPGRTDQRRREREEPGAGPCEIESILSGLEFPATRREMIRHARDLACHEVVVTALRDLPERSYRSPADVMREISNFM